MTENESTASHSRSVESSEWSTTSDDETADDESVRAGITALKMYSVESTSLFKLDNLTDSEGHSMTKVRTEPQGSNFVISGADCSSRTSHCSVVGEFSLEGMFKDLPEHLLEEILNRLPCISSHRSRLVSKHFYSLLSSSSTNRAYWAERKPAEMWIYLYTSRQEALFFDVQNSACYDWKENVFLQIKETYPTFEMAKTCTGSLIFGFAYEDGENLRIWACNPITGKVRQLPPMVEDKVMVLTMQFTRDSICRKRSYFLMVCGINYNLPLWNTSTQLYSSTSNSWVVVSDSDLDNPLHTAYIDSYHHCDGTVLLFDLAFCILGFRDPFWKITCYDIRRKRWSSNRFEAWGTQEKRYSSRWRLFERKWELILFVILRDNWGNGLKGEIWTKLILLPEALQRQWSLLSTMPTYIFERFVGRAGYACASPMGKYGEGSSRSRNSNIFGAKFNMTCLPVPSEVNGDRLVIISTHTQEVVTFSFEPKPPSEVWTISSLSESFKASTYFRSQNSKCWADFPSAKIRQILSDETLNGCSFEPNEFVLP